MIIEEANTRYINCYMHTMNTYSRRTSWSENMSTRGEELPNASIKLEDGTLARKGCLFSFKDYEGEEDNSLYLAAMTDMGYLKFLTEGAFGLDIKSQFHGKTHAELYLPLSVAAESLMCYSRGGLVNTTRITEKKRLPKGYCCPFRLRYCHCYASRRPAAQFS